MGREAVDKHMDSNKLNSSSSGSSSQHMEPAEVKECTTDHNSVADDGSGSHSSSGQRKKLNTPPASHKTRNYTVPKPFSLSAEKPASSVCARARVDDNNNNNNNNSPGNAGSRNSSSGSRGSQPNSPMSARKTVNHMKHHDEEDSFSVASSSATSVRTIKPKVTIGVAPTFSSTSRLERRKEFYKKLEEKQKALEEEKLENEKRLKEEQELVTKQLRKNMVYKANPVPTFYHEPPPQKPPLKKFPLTRPKSPNLNRRKSCSDTVNSSHQEVKGKHCVRHRHSVGGHKEDSKASNSPRRTPDMKKSTKETPKSEEVYGKDKNGHEGEVGEKCIDVVE